MHGFFLPLQISGYTAISPGAADFLNNTGWISKGPAFPFCQPLSLVHVIGYPVALTAALLFRKFNYRVHNGCGWSR